METTKEEKDIRNAFQAKIDALSQEIYQLENRQESLEDKRYALERESEEVLAFLSEARANMDFISYNELSGSHAYKVADLEDQMRRTEYNTQVHFEEERDRLAREARRMEEDREDLYHQRNQLYRQEEDGIREYRRKEANKW